MKAVGIICEYNPFHNGHLYQIEKIKTAFPDKVVVCAMSGNYVERGDIAFADKYTRAKATLESGADLVLEIPFPYSIFSAEGYAIAGTAIIGSISAIDTLAFGCEDENLISLTETSENLMDASFENALSIALADNKSLSYAAVRVNVYKSLFGEPKVDMTLPNNILALEYIKALKKTKSGIIPFAVKREGSGHSDDEMSYGSIASASYIRKNYPESVCFLPENTQNLIKNATKLTINRLFSVLKTKLIMSDSVENMYCFDSLFPIAKKLITDTYSFDELVERLTSKKYTRAFVRRGLISFLLDVPQSLFKTAPEYTVLLGANEKGREILRNNAMDKRGMRIITKPAELNELGDKASLEIKADSLATLCFEKDVPSDYFMKSMPYIKR